MIPIEPEQNIQPVSYRIFGRQLESTNPQKTCDDADFFWQKLPSGELVSIIIDGITRDFSPDGSYPTIAREAADFLREELSRSFYSLCNQQTDKPDYPELLVTSMIHANSALHDFNTQRGYTKENTNYANRDLPGAAAIISVVENNNLHLAMIADATAHIFDNNGGKRVTPIQTDGKEQQWKYVHNAYPEHASLDIWNRYYREHYRNKDGAEGIIDGKPVQTAFGALTGEEEARSFIVSLTIPLNSETIILVTSDGILSVDTAEMHEIIMRHCQEGTPHMILSEIFGHALSQAEDQKHHADDMTAVLMIPQSLIMLYYSHVH